MRWPFVLEKRKSRPRIWGGLLEVSASDLRGSRRCGSRKPTENAFHVPERKLVLRNEDGSPALTGLGVVEGREVGFHLATEGTDNRSLDGVEILDLEPAHPFGDFVLCSLRHWRFSLFI